MTTTIARRTWGIWLLAIAALGVAPARAQFSHLPAVEKSNSRGNALPMTVPMLVEPL